MAQQLQTFQPPHPKKSMVGEQLLIQGSQEQLLTPSRERVLSGETNGIREGEHA